MRRTKEQLRWIAQRLEQYINDKWPGLGCAQVIFDTAGPRDRPINIMLHGIDSQAAVRLLRETADLIEKAEAQESLIVKPGGPLIIPPGVMS